MGVHVFLLVRKLIQLATSPFLGVHFSSVKYIHLVVQQISRSISLYVHWTITPTSPCQLLFYFFNHLFLRVRPLKMAHISGISQDWPLCPWFISSSLATQMVKKICLQCGRPGFINWVGKIPWRRKCQPTPVFLPGKSHGQRSLVVYNAWSRKELDMTEWLHFLYFILHNVIKVCPHDLIHSMWQDFLPF